MGNKYRLTAETKVVFGITFFRIQALKDIPLHGIVKGDLGGWIEKESNLSQSGDAQVSGNALVYGNARVSGNAQVYGNARVSGNAQVYGNARVYGDAQVCGNALVSGSIITASRTDAYTFLVTPCPDGKTRIIAGCRYFTFEEARRHWKETRGSTKLGEESLAIVDHLEAMAKIQGWPVQA